MPRPLTRPRNGPTGRRQFSASSGSERAEGGGRRSGAGWEGRRPPPAPSGPPMTACLAVGGHAHQEEKVCDVLRRGEREEKDLIRGHSHFKCV